MYLQNNNALRLYNILYAQNSSSSQKHVAMLERICDDFAFFFFLKCETRCGRRKEESFGSSTYKTVSSIKNFVMSAKLFYHDVVFTPTLKGATKHIYGHRGERVEPKSWS